MLDEFIKNKKQEIKYLIRILRTLTTYNVIDEKTDLTLLNTMINNFKLHVFAYNFRSLREKLGHYLKETFILII